MTIDKLVNKGLLKKVKVQSPSKEVLEAGHQKSQFVLGHNIIPRTCYSNSICIVEAMREKGEDDWYIVPGFAFNLEGEGPILHSWVKKQLEHYDPTWICYKCRPEDLNYYQKVNFLNPESNISIVDVKEKYLEWEERIHLELRTFACRWKLEVSGYLDQDLG